jgi:predicted nucleic acid-binding protein
VTGPPPHPRGLLDTSIFISIEQGRPIDFGGLPVEQYVSSITRGELLAGVHAAQSADVRAVRLSTIESLAGLSMLSADASAAAEWAKLRHAVFVAGRRPQINDLWIAAVALAHRLPVVTQDDDFDVFAEVGNLHIIKV